MISRVKSLFYVDENGTFDPPFFALYNSICTTKQPAKIQAERMTLESSIDLDLIVLHKLKELSLDLFKKTSQENCLVKNVHQKVVSYSFLGRTTKIQIPSELKIDAIETVHLFMIKELNKKQKGPFKDLNEKQFYTDLSLKWNQFRQRVKINGTHLEFSSDATIRKKEYLEVNNLLLLAIEAVEKLHHNKEEVISSLPLIICEDIDKCKTGLLSRIHHNILPFCIQNQNRIHLPLFPLSVLHRVKNHLVQRTLEEVCNGQIDVHFRNAFFQLMQKIEGLGLTQQELLKPEMLTDLLIRRGHTLGTLPYQPIHKKNKDQFYSFKYLIQETIQCYGELGDDEKELLGFELLSWRNWKLEIFDQIYDLLSPLQKKALSKSSCYRQFLTDNTKDILGSLYLISPLTHLPSKGDFVRICTKNLIKDLIINDKNGELSEFGALLLLQTIGLFEIENSPESLKYQLLEQAASNVCLDRLVEEQLAQKKILQEQIPGNLFCLSIEHLRDNPEKILSLEKDQILQMIQHIEELCLLSHRVIPFHVFDQYSSWPLIFKFNRQSVLDRLTHPDPHKRIRLSDIEPKIIDLDFLIVLLSTASFLISPTEFWKIVPSELYGNLELIHILTDFTPFLAAAPKSILKNETIARHAYEKSPLALKFFDLSPLKSAQWRIEKCVHDVLVVQGKGLARRVVPKMGRVIYVMKYTTILTLVYRLLFIGPLGPLNNLERGIHSITLSTILIKKGMESIYLRG